MNDDDRILNPSRERCLSEIIDARYSRRDMLRAAGKMGALAALAGVANLPSRAFAQVAQTTSSLTFTEIPKSNRSTHQVAPGYEVQLLLRWGDKIMPHAPAFDPKNQTAKSQLAQFGYNNDFLAFIPISPDGMESDHGLLCANHEYTTTYMMFPGMDLSTCKDLVTQEQVDIELAAHGHTVVEVKKDGNRWQTVTDSPYNRRLTPHSTKMDISGPAAGNPRLQTPSDPKGDTIMGTFGNCAGGVTPWRTVLVSEENFNYYFGGQLPADHPETKNHERYGVNGTTWYGWLRFHNRFDLGKEPNEPNRFGWVVEYDPYDPKRQPVKRSALGRFKHETATVTLAPNGRAVVYSGDDEKFEYIYRYVSNNRFDVKNRENNFKLLDDGILYAAKFKENGTLEWLPLVFGQGPLTAANGFNSQGDVAIETRRAADLMGATPMDRPEGIAIHRVSGKVFISLTNNDKRTETNAANPRPHNIHGHIIELQPPVRDHSAKEFTWKIFLRGGDPSKKEDGALYGGEVSKDGWLSCPDNLTMDSRGRLWIASDGQDKSIGMNDGLYATETIGKFAGIPRHFFSGPKGCEVTGPCFTPDGTTLFLSIQHPGDSKEATFDEPVTRWPDFRSDLPTRPTVLAITHSQGEKIGH